MEFKSFNNVLDYVKNLSEEDLLSPVLTKLLIDNGYKEVNDLNIDEKIHLLNNLTDGKYSIVLGDRVQQEVNDIKLNLEKYQHVFNKLYDEESKNVLKNILCYRLTREIKYILDAYSEETEQYFESNITFYRTNCIYVDCGALDGATTIDFILHNPDFNKIYIYEPIKEYFEDCVKNIDKLELKNIIFRNAAVYNKQTALNFSNSLKGSSRADEYGKIKVQAISLDEDIKEKIDFIKMDIEGSEKVAIEGAQNHIKNNAPMLAICVYHLPSDLWELLIMVEKMDERYRFYLRHYTSNANETVLYAVPEDGYQSRDWSKETKQNNLNNIVELGCLRLKNRVIQNNYVDLIKIQKYLMQQLENYQKFDFELEKTNNEISTWNRSLEEGKRYLLQELDNLNNCINALNENKQYLEEQIENRDNVISELKKWIKQLEEAKEYFISEIDNQKIEIEKAEIITKDYEKNINDLINENKKLRYYLKEEVTKPWYKKIVTKNNHDDLNQKL